MAGRTLGGFQPLRDTVAHLGRVTPHGFQALKNPRNLRGRLDDDGDQAVPEFFRGKRVFDLMPHIWRPSRGRRDQNNDSLRPFKSLTDLQRPIVTWKDFIRGIPNAYPPLGKLRGQLPRPLLVLRCVTNKNRHKFKTCISVRRSVNPLRCCLPDRAQSQI